MPDTSMGKKKSVLFITPLAAYGGVETMVLRSAKWLAQHGHRVIICTTPDIDLSIKQTLLTQKAEIFFTSWDNKRPFNFHSLPVCLEEDEALVVVAYYYTAMRIAHYTQRQFSRNQVDVFYYVPHTDGAIYEKISVPHWPWLLKKIMSLYFASYCCRMQRDNKLLFLDEIAACNTMQSYHIKLQGALPVLRLPLFIAEYPRPTVINKWDSKHFEILAITRLDFPFKGYILGLVDAFSSIAAQYSHVKLTLIGYGNGENTLQKKIESQPQAVQSRITWLRGVEYSKLSEHFDNAHVFVGMGTSALDAAQRGVPSIVPIQNQTACSVLGTLDKTPFNLSVSPEDQRSYGVPNNLVSPDQKDVQNYLESILKLTEQEYNQLSMNCYKVIEQHYNIDIILPQLLSLENRNRKSCLNLVKMCGLRILDFFMLLQYKIKAPFRRTKK